MITSDTQNKAVNVLVSINAAIYNIRLYPATSEMIKNSLEKVYRNFSTYFQKDNELVFAESEKSLIVNGRILSEKDFKGVKTEVFLKLFMEHHLKSLTFQIGLKKEEVFEILKIFSKKKEDLEEKGGLTKIIAAKNLMNVFLDQKVFIPLDKDKQNLQNVDYKDRDFLRYITSGKPVTKIDKKLLKNMARDSKSISGFFKLGIERLVDKKRRDSNFNLEENLTFLIRMLEDSTDSFSKEKVSKSLAAHIAKMNDEVISSILNINIEGVFGEWLYYHVVNKIDGEKFDKLLSRYDDTVTDYLGKRRKTKTTESVADAKRNDKVATVSKPRRLARQKKKKPVNFEPPEKIQFQIVEERINSILKGEKEVLNDEDLTQYFSNEIQRLIEKENTSAVESIIERLGVGLFSGNPGIRKGSCEVLMDIGATLFSLDRLDIIMRLSNKLNNWIKVESSFTPAFEKTCIQLRDLAKSLISVGDLSIPNQIIETFKLISDGKFQKDKKIKTLAKDLFENFTDGDTIQLILENFQTDDEKRVKSAIHSLNLIGTASTEHLLDMLRDSQKMSVRLRIIRVVSGIGESALHLVVNRIKKGGSWFYLRNLLLIMGKIGGEEQLDMLIDLTHHEDFRVQREAFTSINSIGSKKSKTRLISSLYTVNDRLKTHIAGMLGSPGNHDMVQPLINILKSKKIVSSPERIKLEETICTTLGRIGDENPVPVLKEIVEEKKIFGIKSYSSEVKAAAVRALSMIKAKSDDEKNDSKGIKEKDLDEKFEQNSSDDNFKHQMTELSQKEKQVARYILRKDKDAAVRLLYDMVVECAHQKKFEKAKTYHHKILAIDPSALNRIVRASEIIEAEKIDGLDADHMNAWSKLYESLTTKEANMFFYGLKNELYEADRTICQQGEVNTRLFLINKGELKIVYNKSGKDILLRTLGKGDVFGHDTFFSTTVCTASVKSLSRVNVEYVERGILEEKKGETPDLISKLHRYCKIHCESIPDLVKKNKLDRRLHRRFDINGKAVIRIINSSGYPIGEGFNGRLSNISEGGLSLIFKASKKGNARVLLGRALNVKIMSQSQKNQPISVKRMIATGVYYQSERDYSLHLKFDKKLSKRAVFEIKRLLNKND